ncbi:AKAP8 protein, partial [Aphelocoma coerulescens]|nr:AKAP8 protein [Aphelocoma coerulescens]
YEGYEYYTPQGSAPTPPGASYGYGGATSGGSWATAKAPELGLASSEGSGAAFGTESAAANGDSIIAKINQRLDLMAKEGTAAAGDSRDQQESSFRYDSFDSYDSRPSLGSSRDPFRASFPFGEAGSERDGAFGSREGAFGSRESPFGSRE